MVEGLLQPGWMWGGHGNLLNVRVTVMEMHVGSAPGGTSRSDLITPGVWSPTLLRRSAHRHTLP